LKVWIFVSYLTWINIKSLRFFINVKQFMWFDI